MSSTRPPLLLLHGVGMSGAVWDGVTQYLATSFRVLAPTAAGHRGGPPLRESATVRYLTDETERYLDDHGIDTAHVAGNSLGGWMAIELARRGRAGSVCAISPSGFWTVGAADDTDATSQVARIRKLAQATGRIASPFLRFELVRRVAMRDTAEHADRMSHGQAVSSMRDLVDCPAADDLLTATEQVAPMSVLPCPVTLAWAELDRLLPPAVNGAVARERLPDARFRILPAVGHVPMIDDPRLCADVINATARMR